MIPDASYDLNGRELLVEYGPLKTTDQQSRPDQPHPDERSARTLQTILKVLLALSYPWITLALVAGAWAFVLVDPTTHRIIAASIFTVFTHVPTWTCWRKGGS